MSTPTRRRFLQLAPAGALALALVGAPTGADAADVEVTVTLSSARIELSESVYLQVEVSTDGGRIGQPSFSGLDGVDVIGRGSSSGMSVEIGGGTRVQRSTKTFTYVLTPGAVGEFEISVEVPVDGKARRPADKPKLVVTGDDAPPPVESGKAGDSPSDIESEVIVWPVVDKASVYVGEQLLYELQIWERASGNLSVSSTPTFKDFWSENLLPDDRNRRRTPERKFVDGVPYRVHQTMLRALFPQKAGTLTIGGPEIQLQPMVGLFGGGGGLPKTFVGRGLAIEVKPLPAKDQPPGFKPNNVGQLTISATVDREQLRQGEAVRLSLRVAGTGNIALIELPALPKIAGLRSYEPKPETPKFAARPTGAAASTAKLEGSRVYSILLVAEQAGTLTIPALELPYFDPDAKTYRIAKTRPIALEVEADPNAVAAPGPNEAGERERDRDRDDEDAELLAPPIAGGELPRTTPKPAWLTRERWWIGTLAAPGVLGLGWLGSKLLDRYGPDDQRRGRNRELARRRTLLAEAGAAVVSGDGFYPRLAALLQAAAIGRAGDDGVGLTRERLIRLLGERGVAPDELESLRGLLDACDSARFGAGSGDVDQRRAHLERARALLSKRGWGPG